MVSMVLPSASTDLNWTYPSAATVSDEARARSWTCRPNEVDELLRNWVWGCGTITKMDRSWLWDTGKTLRRSPAMRWPAKSWFQYYRKEQNWPICLSCIWGRDRAYGCLEWPLVAEVDAMDAACVCFQYHASEFTGASNGPFLLSQVCFSLTELYSHSPSFLSECLTSMPQILIMMSWVVQHVTLPTFTLIQFTPWSTTCILWSTSWRRFGGQSLYA